MTPIRTAALACGLCLTLLAGAPVALAQEADQLDRLPPRIEAGPHVDLRGARIARPGALLLASFDTDGSMTISPAERDAGARRAFANADANADSALSIFEQQEWAARAGSHDGPLANATTFDTNFDRSVSEEEFVAGLARLASAISEDPEVELTFSDLLEAPAGSGPSEGPAPDGNRKPPAKGDRFAGGQVSRK